MSSALPTDGSSPSGRHRGVPTAATFAGIIQLPPPPTEIPGELKQGNLCQRVSPRPAERAAPFEIYTSYDVSAGV